MHGKSSGQINIEVLILSQVNKLEFNAKNNTIFHSFYFILNVISISY